MTQPIQEPSLTRTDAGLGYSARQLLRRPCTPCGSGEIDYAKITWTSADTGPLTVPDSTATPVPLTSEGLTTDPTILQIDLTTGIIWWDFDQRGRPAVATGTVLWDADDADFPGFRQLSLFGTGGLGFPVVNELTGDAYPGSLAWQTTSFNWLISTTEGDTGQIDLGVYHEMGGDVDLLYAEAVMFVWPAKPVTEYITT